MKINDLRLVQGLIVQLPRQSRTMQKTNGVELFTKCAYCQVTRLFTCLQWQKVCREMLASNNIHTKLLARRENPISYFSLTAPCIINSMQFKFHILSPFKSQTSSESSQNTLVKNLSRSFCRCAYNVINHNQRVSILLSAKVCRKHRPLHSIAYIRITRAHTNNRISRCRINKCQRIAFS